MHQNAPLIGDQRQDFALNSVPISLIGHTKIRDRKSNPMLRSQPLRYIMRHLIRLRHRQYCIPTDDIRHILRHRRNRQNTLPHIQFENLSAHVATLSA